MKIESLFDNYDSTNECLPLVVCTSYKRNLYRPNLDNSVAKQVDFKQYQLIRNTRSKNAECCDCHFCKIARLNGKNVPLPQDIFSYKSKRDEILNKSNKGEKVVKRCSNCFLNIKRGMNHACTKSSRVNNINNFVSNTFEPKQKEQLVSLLLKDAVKNKNDTESNLISSTQLKGGRSLNVTIGKNSRTEKLKRTLFSVEDFQKIKTSFNLSYKTTCGLASVIRTATKNLKIIEPGLKRKLLENNHSAHIARMVFAWFLKGFMKGWKPCKNISEKGF